MYIQVYHNMQIANCIVSCNTSERLIVGLAFGGLAPKISLAKDFWEASEELSPHSVAIRIIKQAIKTSEISRRQ